MKKMLFLLMAGVSLSSFAVEITVGSPEVSGCAPIGIG